MFARFNNPTQECRIRIAVTNMIMETIPILIRLLQILSLAILFIPKSTLIAFGVLMNEFKGWHEAL